MQESASDLAFENSRASLTRSAKPTLGPFEAHAAAIGTLTARQRRVFDLLSQGLSNKEIARALGLHESTVKVHVSAILGKLDCPNRTMAALVALYVRLRPAIPDVPTKVALDRNAERGSV